MFIFIVTLVGIVMELMLAMFVFLIFFIKDKIDEKKRLHR